MRPVPEIHPDTDDGDGDGDGDGGGDGFASALVELTEPLRRRAYRLTHDATQADDLLQETMTRAWSARLSFQAGTSRRAWTFTILRNLFLTQLRRSRNVVVLDEHVAERLIAVDADQHERAELVAVLEAIDHLPPDQRSALCAVTLEGMDYRSAADKLNVSQGALKSRVRRARAALMQLVEDGLPRPEVPIMAATKKGSMVRSAPLYPGFAAYGRRPN